MAPKQIVDAGKRIQKNGVIIAKEGEQALRHRIYKTLDRGLALLGKIIISGRKLEESFQAETHRKLERLKQMKTQKPETDAEKDEESLQQHEILRTHTFDFSETSYPENLRRKEIIRKSDYRGRRNKSHLDATVRSH